MKVTTRDGKVRDMTFPHYQRWALESAPSYNRCERYAVEGDKLLVSTIELNYLPNTCSLDIEVYDIIDDSVELDHTLYEEDGCTSCQWTAACRQVTDFFGRVRGVMTEEEQK